MSAGYSKSAFVRRFIAIGLTVLSLVFLFWPAVLGYTDGETRTEYRVLYENRRIYKRSDSYRYEREEALYAYQLGYGEDGGAYLSAKETYADYEYKPSVSLLELRSYYTAFLTLQSIEERNDTYASDSELSELRAENRDQLILFTVALNVLFFGLLLTGVLSILFSLLNKGNGFAITHAVLAFLCAAAVIFIIVSSNRSLREAFHYNESAAASLLIGPDAALFLIPAFALAACIVYRRDRALKGAFPKRGASEAPAPVPVRNPYAPRPVPEIPTPAYGNPDPYAAYVPQPRPVYERPVRVPKAEPKHIYPVPGSAKPAAQPTALFGKTPPSEETPWVCPQCEAQNTPESRFCSLCGSKRPEKMPAEEAPAFCPNCGTALEPGSRFCVFCGTKLF